MDAKQRAKLERYLKNASRFLWGLGPGSQEENYKWLRGEKGLEFKDGTYDSVTNQLLEKYGIETLKEVIVSRVKELFRDKPKAIDLLRDCWQAAITPDLSLLKVLGVDDTKEILPFVEINSQFNYVERWGEFAGVWFEEIEPLQQSANQRRK